MKTKRKAAPPRVASEDAVHKRLPRYLHTHVVANHTWSIDSRQIEQNLISIEVTGPRPAWALDMAEMFRTLAEAIASGSPDARVRTIAQLEIVADAFDRDCSTPKGI